MPVLVLSPDTTVRFRNGRILIHNAHAQHPPVESQDPIVLAFVSSFKSPQDSEAMLAKLPAAQQTVARALVQRLQDLQVLQAPAATSRTPEADKAEALRGLQLLARTTHELAGDLDALDAAQLARSDLSGLSMADRILGLLGAVDQLRHSLAQQIQQSVSADLAALDARPDPPIGLNVGSGERRLDGWINIDAGPSDLRLNINRGLPFDTGSQARIYASHVLEHLFYPGPALAFLMECHRVLAVDGRLRLVVPDIELCLRAYADGDAEFFAARSRLWPSSDPDRTPLEQFLSYAGAGPDPGEFFHNHKYAYDFETLERLLKAAGFQSVQRSAFQDSADPELQIDAHSAVAGAQYDNQQFSLFVEAQK